jgi:hypothetical protein
MMKFVSTVGFIEGFIDEYKIKNMNLNFSKAYNEYGKAELFQDLTKHYLDLVEGDIYSEDHWKEWFIRGNSNSNGNSFREKYRVDPVFILVKIREMCIFKKDIIKIYKHLAKKYPSTSIAYYYSISGL